MKTAITKCLSIGGLRKVDIKVIKISLTDLEKEKFETGEVIYEGTVEDAPEEIKEIHYNKAVLGKTVLIYVCE